MRGLPKIELARVDNFRLFVPSTDFTAWKLTSVIARSPCSLLFNNCDTIHLVHFPSLSVEGYLNFRNITLLRCQSQHSKGS